MVNTRLCIITFFDILFLHVTFLCNQILKLYFEQKNLMWLFFPLLHQIFVVDLREFKSTHFHGTVHKAASCICLHSELLQSKKKIT